MPRGENIEIGSFSGAQGPFSGAQGSKWVSRMGTGKWSLELPRFPVRSSTLIGSQESTGTPFSPEIDPFSPESGGFRPPEGFFALRGHFRVPRGFFALWGRFSPETGRFRVPRGHFRVETGRFRVESQIVVPDGAPKCSALVQRRVSATEIETL